MGTDGVVAAGVATSAVIRVSGRSNRIELSGEPGAVLTVDGGHVTWRNDGSIDITPHQGSGRNTIRIVCPEHSHVVLSTASGSVHVHGHVADVKVITQSGSVEIERAVDVDVRTMSGRVLIGSCVHSCRVVTKSGTVSVGAAHDIGVSTTSARVEVGRTALAAVQTISGSVSVGCEDCATVTARSMSGTVEITLPSGSPATMHLATTSGRIRRDVADGEGATLEVQTTSGAIRIASR